MNEEIEKNEDELTPIIINTNNNIANNSNLHLMKHHLLEKLIEETGFTVHHTVCVVLCLFGVLLEGLHFYIIAAIIIPIKVHYSLHDSQVDMLSSIIFVGFIFGSIFLGILSNYYGRRILVVFASFIILVSQILWTATLNYDLLILVRILSGFGLGMIVPLVNNVISEYLPTKYRGLVLIFIWLGFFFCNY